MEGLAPKTVDRNVLVLWTETVPCRGGRQSQDSTDTNKRVTPTVLGFYSSTPINKYYRCDINFINVPSLSRCIGNMVI